jgi:hypothetical protein
MGNNPNNVLLVKIEGPVWYTIYHHLPVKGVNLQTPLFSSTNQWKRTSMVGYRFISDISIVFMGL